MKNKKYLKFVRLFKKPQHENYLLKDGRVSSEKEMLDTMEYLTSYDLIRKLSNDTYVITSAFNDNQISIYNKIIEQTKFNTQSLEYMIDKINNKYLPALGKHIVYTEDDRKIVDSLEKSLINNKLNIENLTNLIKLLE